MGKRIDIPKNMLEKMLYKEHKSIASIANELGVHKGVVTRNMKEHGLKTRAEHQKDVLTRDVLYQKYIIEEKSVKALHKELGCGRDWLRGRLAEYGLLRTADYDPSSDDREELTRELLYREYVEEGASVAEISRRHGYKPVTVRRHLRKEGLFESKTSSDGMNSSNIASQKISDNEEFIRLVERGTTVSELCSIYECSSDTVYRKKEQLGLSNAKARLDIPREETVAMYLDDKMGMDEIASRYGCSCGTIRNRLIEWGVEIREPDETNHIDFEEESVRLMLEQGMSYAAIATMYSCATTSVRNFAIKHGLDEFATSMISLDESKVMRMLDEYGIAYSIHDRKLLHGREIDVMLDEHNVGVEVSPCFTHNSDIGIPHCGDIPKCDDYHMSKAHAAREAGILLVTKFDWMESARLKHHIFNLMEPEDRRKYGITFSKPFVRHINDESKKREILKKIAKCSTSFHEQNLATPSEEFMCFEATDDEGKVLMSILLIRAAMNETWDMFVDRDESAGPFDEVSSFQNVVDELDSLPETHAVRYMASLDFCEDVLLENVGFERREIIEPSFRFVHKKGRKTMLMCEAVEHFSNGTHLGKAEIIERANREHWYRVFDCGYTVMERQLGNN